MDAKKFERKFKMFQVKNGVMPLSQNQADVEVKIRSFKMQS